MGLRFSESNPARDRWRNLARSPDLRRSLARSLLVLLAIAGLWLAGAGGARAESLAARAAAFPDWGRKPNLERAVGDLVYPDWMAGTWEVTSVLEAAIAPLAPEVVTPGFAGNRAALGESVVFAARFEPSARPAPRRFDRGPFPAPLLARNAANRPADPPTADRPVANRPAIVADRAFNGLNLARAVLGSEAVQAVRTDPDDPNRQLTVFRGDRQLRSTVLARRTAARSGADGDRFLAAELTRQSFRGAPQVYFNDVETLADYRHYPGAPAPVVADQMTAVYLSPRDRDFFRAGDRPVALYRYRLTFAPLPPAGEANPGGNPERDRPETRPGRRGRAELDIQ